MNVCYASTSSIEHISICPRCKDVDANVAMIKSLNGHIAKLEDQAKIGTMNLRMRSLNMAGQPFLNGRRPGINGIKDGVDFQSGAKYNTKVKVNGEREMCPWAISSIFW